MPIKPLKINYNPVGHTPALDGIRGLAIFLVVVYHCLPSLYKVGTGIGWIGVDLFFVLSGFLITGILIETKGNTPFFSRFYLRRTLRIFPLYYFFLIVFFFLLPLFMPDWRTDYSFYYDNQWWYWLYIPNWLIAFQNSWPPVPKPILDHFWSLAIEEQFYLFWPFVVYFSDRKHLWKYCLFFILLSLGLRNVFVSTGLSYATSYVFSFTRFDAICTGALLAVWIRDASKKEFLAAKAPYFLLSMVVLLLGIIVLSKSISLKDPYFIRAGYTVVAFLFGSLLLCALSDNHPIKTLCEMKWLRWLGTYSYGIYIFHWFLYPLLYPALDKRIGVTASPFLHGLLISLVCIGLILVLAVASYHLFEKHFLKWRKTKN